MKKKRYKVGMAIAFALLVSQPLTNMGQANERNGKHLFVENCRSCHSENGSAFDLNPDSMTQAEWSNLLIDGGIKKLGCKDVWTEQSGLQQSDVFTFVYQHAHDSKSPKKCK